MTGFPNPLVPGFNPDPSIVRVDDAYYLVTSTLEYLPGLPVYRSDDLVTWEQIGNVATRPEQVEVGLVGAGMGVWAPTIRHRDGTFYVIVTIAGPGAACCSRPTIPPVHGPTASRSRASAASTRTSRGTGTGRPT